MPVWLDRIASEADWIGVVNRVKPHTDFKGSRVEEAGVLALTFGPAESAGAGAAPR